ncbi:MAG: hypothetical protein R3275_08185 [Saprospiraceae bacterium]|nr:hypothetical protein [Saprospiraceae bacterium]
MLKSKIFFLALTGAFLILQSCSKEDADEFPRVYEFDSLYAKEQLVAAVTGNGYKELQRDEYSGYLEMIFGDIDGYLKLYNDSSFIEFIFPKIELRSDNELKIYIRENGQLMDTTVNYEVSPNGDILIGGEKLNGITYIDGELDGSLLFQAYVSYARPGYPTGGVYLDSYEGQTLSQTIEDFMIEKNLIESDTLGAAILGVNYIPQ